jgi:hypothetical protein
LSDLISVSHPPAVYAKFSNRPVIVLIGRIHL